MPFLFSKLYLTNVGERCIVKNYNYGKEPTMQSKYIKMLSDEQRVCRACGYESSPNDGPIDDLRYFNQGAYHPSCHEEVDRLIQTFNESGVPREKAIQIFEQLGINLEILSVNGVSAVKLAKK